MADPIPCPCCGGTRISVFRHVASQPEPCCMCRDCFLSAISIAAWNRRATRTADMQAAYLAGFMASGENGNGEYPYRDGGLSPLDDDEWLAERDKTLADLGVTKKETDNG